MESLANEPPLIFITGQTASGKSDLGMDLSRRYGGEIVCVDSRTIYRGMDIGTAKPSGADRAAVPHHLLDIAEVNHPLTVHEFKLLADEAIAAIIARGKLPIVVGGAGLYSDAVLYGFEFAGPPDPEKRASLSRLSVPELRQICEDQGIPLPLNEYNPRHLIRHIETHGQMGRAGIGYKNALTLGIEVAPDTLKSRIQERARRMIEQGLPAEVRMLVDTYGWSDILLHTIGYREFYPDFGDTPEKMQEIVRLIIQGTQQLAKRQKTWFKRNKNIRWISNSAEAVEIATTYLNK